MASIYAGVVLADSPVGYWPLNESSGTVAKDVAGTNPGTYSGGFTLGQAGGIPSTSDTSVAFDGTNGQVNTVASTSLNCTTQASTVECWLFLRSVAATPQGIVSHSNGGGVNGQYDLYWDATQQLVYHYGDQTSGSPKVSWTPSPTLLNTWVHVVGQSDLSGNTYLYVNGVQVASAAPGAGFTFHSPTVALSIGIFSGGTDPANMRAQHVAVYDKRLSATQILTHYRAGLYDLTKPYAGVVLADSPVGYWRLGEASGTVAADASGNGHAGTYTNSPTLARSALLNGDPATSVLFASTAYAEAPSSAAFSLTTVTMEAWIYRTGAIPASTSLITHPTGSGAYAMRIAVTTNHLLFAAHNVTTTTPDLWWRSTRSTTWS